MITRVLGAIVAIMALTILVSFWLTQNRGAHQTHSPFVPPSEFGVIKSQHHHPGTRVSYAQLKEMMNTNPRRQTEDESIPIDDINDEPIDDDTPAPPTPPRQRQRQPPAPRDQPKTGTPVLYEGKVPQKPRAPPRPDDEVSRQRQLAVIDGFKHAWRAYDARCFGKDELHPVSNRCSDWLSQGLTIVDSLDTIWLMGLTDEFAKARDWVANSLQFQSKGVSFFETTIRVLGGLLSAYDLSREQVFLTKAKDLGDRLSAAFETPTGLPRGEVNLGTRHSNNPSWTGGASLIAEVGTVQLEFAYLSKHTGDPSYAQKSLKVYDHLDSLTKPRKGLYPIYIDPNSGQFTNQKITFGAMGDSFYEYLLKIWILTGKKNDQYKRMYLESVDGMREHLLTKSSEGLWYLADLENGHKQHKMDHLVCFAPAMLALGVINGVVEGAEAERHLQMAKDLCETCYQMYATSPTGIGAEYVNFNPSMSIGAAEYHLRPEAVEAIFLLWRATKDNKYREQGWKMFQAIEQHCRIGNGYTGLSNVRNGAAKQDKMESFFLAETLKYLFLLYSPDDALPLDGPNAKVFNTECHPLGAWDITS